MKLLPVYSPVEEPPQTFYRDFSKRPGSLSISPASVIPVVNRLDAEHCDPSQQIPVEELVVRIVSLAQIMVEKSFYTYQLSPACRIVESLLLHDMECLTSLFSRQSGKTELIGGINSALAAALPYLALKYPGDWKLNITDEQGRYRGFKHGIKIGIYAPRLDQAQIMFERIRDTYETNSSLRVLRDFKVRTEVNNGNTLSLTNGSRILSESASEQSKIEGATHNLLCLEESQDISDLKVRKSLSPMVASTAGTTVKIGTASTQKCDFYSSIQENKRLEMVTGKKNHFFYPHYICSKFNSLYRKHVEKEKIRLGESSDEFRLSYGCEFIFERGMFIVPDVLFHPKVAQTAGVYSDFHIFDRPDALKYMSVVAGIDWGQSLDSTFVCFMAVDWNNPLDSGEVCDSNGVHRFTYYMKHVLGFMEWQGDNYEYQFGELSSIFAKVPNLRKIIMDSNACGKPLYDRAHAVFVPQGIEVEEFNFQAKTKSDGYKELSSDFWANRITFPASKQTRKNPLYRKFIQQMLDLKKDYRQGLMVVEHPDEKDAHDDAPDSLMVAAWGCCTPANLFTPFGSMSNPFC